MPSKIGFRSTFFDLVLYPDCSEHMETLSALQDSGLPFAGCLHDRDKTEDDLLKKAHMHIVVWGLRTTIAGFATKFHIAENYISMHGSLQSRLRYLIHADNPDKFQYSADSVFGSPAGLKKFRESLNVSEDENDNVFSIISLLESYPPDEYVTLLTFVKDVCSSSLFPYYRRSQSTFIELWRERNNFIMKGKN